MLGKSMSETFNRRGPMRLLTLGLVLGLLLVPLLGSVVWSMYGFLSKVGTHDLKLQRIAGSIAHLNAALTMYARLAAATGDPEWERNYNATQPLLDSAILEIAIESREEYEKNYAAQTKMAYTKLLELESVALALARQGKLKKAYEILLSSEYEKQKALYSDGINKMIDAVRGRINQEIEEFRKRLWVIGVIEVTTLTIIIVAWIGASILLRSHLAFRRKAEESLAEEKERLSVTLSSIDQGVISTDLNGRVNLMNPVAETLTGWRSELAIGRDLKDVLIIRNERADESHENLVSGILENYSGNKQGDQNVLISLNGSRRLISYSATPMKNKEGALIGLALIFRDITEQEHMRKEVSKAEKLESIGILAGGIAHDFNNILTAIMGNISLAKLEVDPATSPYARLHETEWASRKAKDLAGQLLAFSRGGAPIKTVVSVKDLLQQWVEFPLRGSNVTWDLKICENLWNVDIDEGQMSQVIHNLIINADQAMPYGGKIFVMAENYLHQESKHFKMQSGKYVKISVADEGMGISARDLEKIFDPYFTTKPTGTGMGLASSYAAVKRHGGHIDVKSRVGAGTVFSVFLPACEESVSYEAKASLAISKSSGRVLVMDDEPLIRDLAGELLTYLGYTVSTTHDGLEAINLYLESKENGRPFDAVIMDLTIPGGMGGIEAIEKLRQLDPEVKAIVSSGYSNDPIMGDFVKFGFSGVLPKPYNAQQMSQILQTIIGKGNPATAN